MGFVKIPRDLENWAWYSDNNTLSVYIRLLLGAAWCDTAYRNVTLRRGEIATSFSMIAKENNISERQARTIIERLKSTGKVSVRTTSKFSIITLIDYDRKSEGDSQNDSLPTSKRQAACQSNDKPSLLNKKDKKGRSEEYAREAPPELLGEVKRAYNDICVSLPPIRGELTPRQARLIGQAGASLRGIGFEEYFGRAERSDFLTGRTGGSFKADLDWLLKPENVEKVLAGRYDRSYDTPRERPKDYTGSLW